MNEVSRNLKVSLSRVWPQLFIVMTALVAMAMLSSCTKVKSSLYGNSYRDELENIVDACTRKQREGDLPGFEAGRDKTLVFTNDEADLQDRDEVSYPLYLRCIVNKDGRKFIFDFVKETPKGDWDLSR